MALNSIQGVMSVIFPLITFPYVSRILGVENLGKYNFSVSLISYFVLLAGLGASDYARREGAKVRDERQGFNQFANEVFSINILSTILSYVFLFIYLSYSTKVQDYSGIVLVLSLNVLLGTIGVNWIFAVYEDYLYTTLRYIIFHLFSIAMLFLFVKGENDLIKYVWISVIASGGANLLNFIYSRKYCNLRIVFHAGMTRHLKPIMIFFASVVSVTIYVHSDTTILGYMTDDYHVGLYSVSVRVYAIVKSILASAIVVSIARLSNMVGQKNFSGYNNTASGVYQTILTLVLPVMIGLLIYSKEIILLISGEEYIGAELSLQLLGFAMITYLFAYFWAQCVMVPNGREWAVFVITVVSAVLNVGLNLLLIPFFQQNAAAFTTFISEGCTAVCCMVIGYKYVKLNGVKSTFFKTLAGCFLIVIIAVPMKLFIANSMVRILSAVVVSGLAYLICEVMLRNKALNFVTNRILKKNQR